jgi:hypothetical protein
VHGTEPRTIHEPGEQSRRILIVGALRADGIGKTGEWVWKLGRRTLLNPTKRKNLCGHGVLIGHPEG